MTPNDPTEPPETTNAEPSASAAGQRPAHVPADAVGEEDGAITAESIRIDIEQEVARLRAEGKYPPSLLAKVRAVYNATLPTGAAGGAKDFRSSFRLLDRNAYIDIYVPTDSRKPGVALVKRTIRSLVAWYLTYITQQFNNFASRLMHVIGILDARLSRLEETGGENAWSELAWIGPTSGLAAQSILAGPIQDALTEVPGRVLVLECGEGKLLSTLRRSGLSAYGIDERAELLDTAERSGLEVRHVSASEHLAGVAPGSLSGLVLSGVVDRSGAHVRVSLLRQAAAALAKGGILAIASAGQELFDSESNVVEAELSDGRPYSPKVWEHLAAKAGFTQVRTMAQDTSGAYLVVAVAGNNRRGNESVQSWVIEEDQIPEERQRP